MGHTRIRGGTEKKFLYLESNIHQETMARSAGKKRSRSGKKNSRKSPSAFEAFRRAREHAEDVYEENGITVFKFRGRSYKRKELENITVWKGVGKKKSRKSRR